MVKEFGERGRETVGNRKTHGSKGDGQMRRGDEEDWGRERGVQEENREWGNRGRGTGDCWIYVREKDRGGRVDIRGQ